jgi:hypothetical protein
MSPRDTRLCPARRVGEAGATPIDYIWSGIWNTIVAALVVAGSGGDEVPMFSATVYLPRWSVS